MSGIAFAAFDPRFPYCVITTGLMVVIVTIFFSFIPFLKTMLHQGSKSLLKKKPKPGIGMK